MFAADTDRLRRRCQKMKNDVLTTARRFVRHQVCKTPGVFFDGKNVEINFYSANIWRCRLLQ